MKKKFHLPTCTDDECKVCIDAEFSGAWIAGFLLFIFALVTVF